MPDEFQSLDDIRADIKRRLTGVESPPIPPSEVAAPAKDVAPPVQMPSFQSMDEIKADMRKRLGIAPVAQTPPQIPEVSAPPTPQTIPITEPTAPPPRMPAIPTVREQPLVLGGEREGIGGFLGEIGASVARGAGGVLGMPRGILGALGLKTETTEELAKTGKELARAYPESPSVAVGITEKPSLLANPKWWAAAAPSMVMQLIPIALATVGGTVAGGPPTGALAGAGAGGLIGVADAGERMLAWEEEHGQELPTLNKVLIGLGAGVAGAWLPGRTVGRLVGGKVVSEAAEKALMKIFQDETIGKAIADRAVHSVLSGSNMAAFSVIENAFEKYGYRPERDLTQGVLESLVLGTAVGGGSVQKSGNLRNEQESGHLPLRGRPPLMNTSNNIL